MDSPNYFDHENKLNDGYFNQDEQLLYIDFINYLQYAVSKCSMPEIFTNPKFKYLRAYRNCGNTATADVKKTIDNISKSDPTRCRSFFYVRFTDEIGFYDIPVNYDCKINEIELAFSGKICNRILNNNLFAKAKILYKKNYKPNVTIYLAKLFMSINQVLFDIDIVKQIIVPYL